MNRGEIVRFFERLGQRYTQPADLFLIGGAALCLLGNPRTTLDIDFIGSDFPPSEQRAPGTLREVLETLAVEMQIVIDHVPLEQFIPLPSDGAARHHFVGVFGSLQVFIFDPYAIALSKLDRGLPSDIQDIAFLISRDLIALTEFVAIVEWALSRAVEFGLNQGEMRARLTQLQKGLQRE